MLFCGTWQRTPTVLSLVYISSLLLFLLRLRPHLRPFNVYYIVRLIDCHTDWITPFFYFLLLTLFFLLYVHIYLYLFVSRQALVLVQLHYYSFPLFFFFLFLIELFEP